MCAFDYLVIGGGTAGAVVARRLAESQVGTVCLLEAGPSDEDNERVLSLRDWMTVAESGVNRDYPSVAAADSGHAVVHTRAAVLGGCSSHNAAIAFKPLDSDLDAWVSTGADGWDPASLAPAWQRLRERVQIADAPDVNPVSRAFIAAGQQVGLPFKRFNVDPPGRGVGWLQLNQRDGMRHSSSVAYLHPLASLPAQLKVRTGVRVLRLVLAEGRVTGVETTEGTIDARREIVVAAGAFESPKLLALSGIGPAGNLAALGIQVHADVPGVGRHLLDHPEATMAWEAAQPIPQESAQFWDAACFDGSSPEAGQPDVMIHFGLSAPDFEGALAGYPTAEHVLCMTPNVMHPRSEGSLRIRSADPDEPPLIDFRYFSDPDAYDIQTMAAGLALCRRIAAAPALRSWIKRELAPGSAANSAEGLARFVGTTHTTVSHPAGTCKIGRASDPLGVVDPQLRVRGISGLRVADASVFPLMTAVNPCLTCMLIGERCAELIAAEAGAAG